ncbi:hydroxyacylglutathione hydrolase [Leptothrix discophora]|uniref:Hydroxyacylglutathione hydrolase n=1 Tax=Leptothrix discophora TaxID=89 RepID=A0ABT9FZ18_LEPDI|nr:hydroxyacylglutathione hydrolase [Leptothrix discophora]MDP4299479.1 hydroxyacylglutathione hydrolase [Leptothrix discophora]
MNLVALPAFDDNYIWMLHDGHQALVVDPGDAEPVRAALERHSLELAAILVTHHHGDHVGGVCALLASNPAPVWGPARESLPVEVTRVSDGDLVRIDALGGLAIDVIDVPGHTAGHVAYVVPARDGQPPILFCGDTLFSAGCGRLFEGTPAQMHASLGRLAALPSDTRVCCAHEYTLANLRFARAVEPDNPAIQAHQSRCESLRDERVPTLPSHIALERQINPYLRCDQPQVMASAATRGANPADPVSVLATIRAWKNEFR